MKLEIFSKPQVNHFVIGKNFSNEAVLEFDSTPKRLGDVMEVMGGKFFAMAQHLHYAFYFHLPPDFLTDVLCYSNLRASRNQYSHDMDEGLMSGNLEEFFRAIAIFCQKTVDRDLRAFFNVLYTLLETDGVSMPFNKVDLGDKTFSVKQS